VTDPVLRLDPERISVAPGAQAALTVTVHNPGDIVEGYDLDVVGEIPLPWARVDPPFVSVYPKQDVGASVVFSPPAGGVAASGDIPFGVRARSRVDPGSSAVVEGDVDIGQVLGLQGKLTPVTSSGRWRGRHTIAISNWGNSAVRLRITVTDPDQQLGFLLYPDVVEVPLGATATARLKVRTRTPTLRGTPRQLQFEVVAERDPAPPVTGLASAASTPDRPVLRGVFAQKPILSRATVGLAAGALVLALAGGGLAFALSRGSGSDTPALAPITKTITTTVNGTPTTVITTVTPSSTPATSPSSTASTTSASTTTTGSTTTSLGGDLTPGVWIALAGAFPGALSPSDSPEAQQLLSSLQSKGAQDVGFLDSGQFPGLAFGGLPIQTRSLIVYVGPYASPGDAAASCVNYLGASQAPICSEGQIPAPGGASTPTTP
jgi:hypothetical protein